MRPFHVEQFLGDSCPTSLATRWFRLARYFRHRAAVEPHLDDARDAVAAACACRAIATSCWQIAQQRQGEQPQAEPPRHRMPIGRAELDRTGR